MVILTNQFHNCDILRLLLPMWQIEFVTEWIKSNKKSEKEAQGNCSYKYFSSLQTNTYFNLDKYELVSDWIKSEKEAEGTFSAK